VADSRLRPRDFVRAPLELARLWRRHRGAGRAAEAGSG
jgi:hypothetical protein